MNSKGIDIVNFKHTKSAEYTLKSPTDRANA